MVEETRQETREERLARLVEEVRKAQRIITGVSGPMPPDAAQAASLRWAITIQGELLLALAEGAQEIGAATAQLRNHPILGGLIRQLGG